MRLACTRARTTTSWTRGARVRFPRGASSGQRWRVGLKIRGPANLAGTWSAQPVHASPRPPRAAHRRQARPPPAYLRVSTCAGDLTGPFAARAHLNRAVCPPGQLFSELARTIRGFYTRDFETPARYPSAPLFHFCEALGMPKRTAFGVVLKQQAASAFAEYQDGDAPPAQNGPQLAVPVLPPPHAPPPIVYPWAMPGPSQQETSQQEPSALDLETEFEVARSKAQTPRPPPCPRTRGRRRRARMQSWWWTRRPCPRIRPTLRTALSRLRMSFPSRQRAASSQSEGLLRACENTGDGARV